MQQSQLTLLSCLILLLVPACVSKTKYMELEKNLLDTRQELEYTEVRLSYTEQSRDTCVDGLMDSQGTHKELRQANSQLSNDIDDLRSSLKNRESTIEEQTMVIRNLAATKESIETSLKEQIEAQEVKIEEIEGKLKLTFVDKILFDTGSVTIRGKGKEILLELADSLRKDKDHEIMVEGHTDDVPIGFTLMDLYPTNWELSAARALGVVRFLQEKGWLEPERLSAAAYSHYQPVASNDTEDGRRQNRRIEIILVPAR